MAERRFNNGSDLQHRYPLQHASRLPRTQGELTDWLDDTAALPEAEVYRFVKPELAHEIRQDAAERMYLDVRSDFYTAEEALERYQLRQAGIGRFCVIEAVDGSRRTVQPLSEQPSVAS